MFVKRGGVFITLCTDKIEKIRTIAAEEGKKGVKHAKEKITYRSFCRADADRNGSNGESRKCVGLDPRIY